MYNNGSFLGSIPPVTKNILIINVLIWFAQTLLSNLNEYILGYGALFPIASDYFMPHQILTYMFLHGGFSHMFFNMFAVFMFGRTLEYVWGPKRFLSYYLLTGIGAGLTQILVCYLTGSMSATVGASGAVFGILVAFGLLFPNTQLYIIPFPFPIKAKWFVIGYGLLELSLGISNNVNDNVAHFAHLGGLITGLFIVLYWRKKDRKNNERFF